MALVAELVTKLTADQTQFNAQMRNAGTSVADFAKKAAIAIGAIWTAKELIAGVKAFSNAISETADQIDQLQERASKLNTGVEALQKLEYAGKLTGASVETVSGAMSKLIKNIGEARSETGPAADAFKRLGLNAKELQGMSVDQSVLAISNALKGITSANEQNQISLKIFGRGATEIMNLLRSDLSATNKEFDSLGMAISQKGAKGVDGYRDSVVKLNTILDSFWVKLTVAISPALEKINILITEQIIKFGGLGPLANAVAKAVIGGLITMAKGFQGFLNLLESVVIKFKEARLAALAFFQGVGTKGLEGQIQNATISLNSSLTQQAQGGVTDNLIKGLQAIGDSLEKQGTKPAEVGLTVTVEPSPLFITQVKKDTETTMRSLLADAARQQGRRGL